MENDIRVDLIAVGFYQPKLCLERTLILYDVLYVPDARQNLCIICYVMFYFSISNNR